MPVTINASTSSGLVQSADTSGQIELQTNGTTVATVNTSNNVQFRSSISVGNATPTTSGAGITFPATQSSSSNANTLDDYEEGSWTPTIQGSTTGGTTTYSNQNGWYVKVGTIVTVGFYVNWSAATGTGTMLIGGLPFASGGGTNYVTGSLMTGNIDWTGGTMATLYKPPGNSHFEIYCSGDNIGWVQQAMDGGGELLGGCTYSV